MAEEAVIPHKIPWTLIWLLYIALHLIARLSHASAQSDLERVAVITSGILPPVLEDDPHSRALDLDADQAPDSTFNESSAGEAVEAEDVTVCKLTRIRLYTSLQNSSDLIESVAEELAKENPQAEIEIRSRDLSPAMNTYLVLPQETPSDVPGRTRRWRPTYTPLLVETLDNQLVFDNGSDSDTLHPLNASSDKPALRDVVIAPVPLEGPEDGDNQKRGVKAKMSEKNARPGSSLIGALRRIAPWLKLHPGGVSEPKPLPQHDLGTEELPDPSMYKYGLMIDSGSTGNRIFIYRWHPRVRSLHVLADSSSPAPMPPFSRPITQHEWSMKTMPGLSAFARNPSDAGPQTLSPLITFAYRVFISLNATEKIAESPIFLKATGGLRALPEVIRSKIMQEVREFLAQTGFRFEPQWAQIISGEEEGVYGWLTVNYLVSGHTVFADQVSGMARPGYRNHTVGALDLGGASMQSTFRPVENQTILANKFSLDIAGTHNELYTECFWYYGKDTALWRVHNILFATAFPNIVSLKSALPYGWNMIVPNASLSSIHAEHQIGPSNGGILQPIVDSKSAGSSSTKPSRDGSGAGAGTKKVRLPRVLKRYRKSLNKARHLAHRSGIVHAPIQRDSSESVDLTDEMREHLNNAAKNHVMRFTSSVGKALTKPKRSASPSIEDDALVFRSPCLPLGFEALFQGANGLAAVVVGDPDWDTCYELASHVIKTRITGPCVTDDRNEALKRGRHGLPAEPSVVDEAEAEPADDKISPFPGECTSFFGFYRPDISNRTFYAFSGFGYFPSFFNMPNNSTLDEIEQKGREICQLNWSELMNKYPQADRYYLRSYCWLSVYTVALLHKGFGFPKAIPPVVTPSGNISQPYPIVWTSKLGGTDVTFALGAMLYESNRLPWHLGPDVMARDLASAVSLYRRLFFVTLLALVASMLYQVYQCRRVPSDANLSRSARPRAGARHEQGAASESSAQDWEDGDGKAHERQSLLGYPDYGSLDQSVKSPD